MMNERIIPAPRSSCKAMALVLTILLLSSTGWSQPKRQDIYTDFVLYQKRVTLEKDLRERIIGHTFSMPLDSNSEDRYLSACWAISQFLFYSPDVERGFANLFAGYTTLSYDTQQSFLEAVYAVAPLRYTGQVRRILDSETDEHLFALCAVYLFRADTGTENVNDLKIRMVEKFPGYDTLPRLQELDRYLTRHSNDLRSPTPDIGALFRYQASAGQKTVFSFQRWDRDRPGAAIVMDEKGHFIRDAQGHLRIFEQLARSGSDLPWFLTNGSTPQGIYSIQGTDVSRTSFIGPTPNLQLLMPFEGSWNKYFGSVLLPEGQGFDSLQLYKELLPPSWRRYIPMMEAWSAGRIGRTEIIAHGTTIDPEYFKDKPWYPLTPTMGCLCAKELWNPTSGHLLVSEQFNLLTAFLSTPGNKGYLYVIDIDNQHKPVTRAELEALVNKTATP